MKVSQSQKGLHSKALSGKNLHYHNFLDINKLNQIRTVTNDQKKIEGRGTDQKEATNIDLYMSKGEGIKSKCSSIVSLIKHNGFADARNITIQSLLNPNFAVLQYRIKDLVQFSKLILQTNQFCKINFPGKIVKKMVSLLADNYHSVAYHNFSHAFSLMLLNYQCLSKCFWLKYLYTEEEIFYILISGLAHDINHPGTNNQYEIKSKSLLAQHFNNQSVLENMHINHLWKILKNNPQYNFVEASQDKNKVKNIITRLILNTDMAFHNQNLQQLTNLKKNNEFDPKHNSDHKWLLMTQIFHACDIGNSCSQFENYINWSALVICEFTDQVQKEELHGLQVSKNLIFNDVLHVYEDQIWFVGNLVQPLWKQIIHICPDLSYLDTIISQNLTKVKEQLRKLKG